MMPGWGIAFLIIMLGANLARAAELRNFDQNWNDQVKEAYAFTPQGSKIIPYDWAMALRRSDDETPFFTSKSLAQFGYISQTASTMNPDGLPIGFTRDNEPAGATRWESLRGSAPAYATKPQLGMNCAACHTSELSYRGDKLRIYGGASYSNFQLFVKEMDESVQGVATENETNQRNNARFMRFADTVARREGTKPTSSYLQKLRAELGEFSQYRQRWEAANGLEKAGLSYGPGRNDAFGVIFNQTLAEFTGIEANVRSPNAPVKYPVMWDTPYHEVVQWIGIARNSPDAGGPIARNIGQVLGVFGHSELNRSSYVRGYCTSAKRKELNEHEDWIRTLRSPSWPKDIFGFDAASARRGAELYQKNCVGCHALPERAPDEANAHRLKLNLGDLVISQSPTASPRKANEKMVPISEVGTDPLTFRNAAERTALTGSLEGRAVKVFGGRTLEREEPAATLLRHIVAGSILGSFSYLTCSNTPRDGSANLGLGRAMLSKALHFTKEDADHEGDLQSRVSAFKSALSNYKARPLNGIWSAPPYLHNGSVRSLEQLLTPASDRDREFVFNCNEFDPVAVGIDCSRVDSTNRVASDFKFDTAKAGNSNQGHEYGTHLLRQEKLDLIEYIKAL